MDKPDKTSDQITCQESVYLVSLLRDQSLDQLGKLCLDQHLKSCLNCQIAKQQFEILFAGLDDLLAK
jgi:hypothetical protein